MKKSYKLFVVWLVGFIGTLIGVSFLGRWLWPEMADSYLVKMIGVLTSLALVILCYMIYKTEQIYWINGVSYKEAVEATSEQKKIMR